MLYEQVSVPRSPPPPISFMFQGGENHTTEITQHSKCKTERPQMLYEQFIVQDPPKKKKKKIKPADYIFAHSNEFGHKPNVNWEGENKAWMILPTVMKSIAPRGRGRIVSNRTEYPVLTPRGSLRSKATRSAMEVALIRRGCEMYKKSYSHVANTINTEYSSSKSNNNLQVFRVPARNMIWKTHFISFDAACIPTLSWLL